MEDKCVVLVDSDGEDCFILQQAFSRWGPGVTIDQFCSPEEFLSSAQWKLNRPKVILLELVLLGEKGLDWLPVFLDHECCHKIPVVMYSGLETERQVCLNLGAADFIRKPDSFSEMKLVVDQVWQSY
ncbi:response regulator, partial [Spirosoma utsteinense]